MKRNTTQTQSATAIAGSRYLIAYSQSLLYEMMQANSQRKLEKLVDQFVTSDSNPNIPSESMTPLDISTLLFKLLSVKTS